MTYESNFYFKYTDGRYWQVSEMVILRCDVDRAIIRSPKAIRVGSMASVSVLMMYLRQKGLMTLYDSTC